MKHGRRDENHVRAGELARAAGFTTADLGDAGEGFPDWAWGKHGLNFLVEIKSSPSASLTDKQVVFAATWRGQWVRADTPEEAVNMAQSYVQSFTRVVTSGCVAWNARPVISAALAMERSIVEPRTRRRAGRGRAKGPRRGQ